MIWLRRVIFTTILLAGLGMVAIAFMIRHFEEGLPSTAELRRYSPPQVTRILARDGTLLGEDFIERRTVVPLAAIPSHVKLAFLAAEDASFYEHEGLDYPGMLRAIWVNLRSQSSRQGASTITQQVVKNVVLSQEKTYERKIKEVILSRRIEQELTKDDILELYLNHIYFGHGRYGVEEAAQYYFGKPIGMLTLGEATLLASVPKGPSLYSPREHLDRTMRRRAFVLSQMVDKKFVSEAMAADALREVPVIAPPPEHKPEIAPEAIAQAKRTLKALVGEEAQRGGYTITTTIDPALQIAAREAVRENLNAFDKRQKLVGPLARPKKPAAPLFEGNPITSKDPLFWGEVTGADDTKGWLLVRVGAASGHVDLGKALRYNPDRLAPSKFAEPGVRVRLSLLSKGDKDKDGQRTAEFKLELGPQGAMVAIDVASREVLALVGSYEGARGTLDRASFSQRQPGSSFKAFVAAEALRSRRFTPASLVPTDPNTLSGYKPKNYDPKAAGGPTRLRDALSRSVNTSAAWLIGELGPSSVVDIAHALGIESTLGATPSLALGAYEVNVREMTAAYASLPGGGVYREPILISRITGPNGQDIPLPAREPDRQALSEAEAFLVVDLLRSVVTDGTARSAKSLKRPIAGKTGTSNEARDAWFAGFSTDIACVVWTGHDDRLPLGPGETGGSAALPAFIDFMRASHVGRPALDFPIPPGLTKTFIDPKTGLLARPDQEDAMSEFFLTGTEPIETAPAPDAVATIDGASPPVVEP